MSRCQHGRVLTPGLCWKCEVERQEASGSLPPAHGWAAGDTLRFPPYKTVFKVEQVVERGLVLSIAENGSHKHLCEWARVLEGERPNEKAQ